MFWGWLWVNRWTEPVGGGQGGSVQGTCTRRHIQCQACVADPHHLPRGEYFIMPILQKKKLRLGEGLVFWVPLCTPSCCLFVALPLLIASLPCSPRGSSLTSLPLPTQPECPQVLLIPWHSCLPSVPPLSHRCWLRLPSTHLGRCSPAPHCRLCLLIPKPDLLTAQHPSDRVLSQAP